MPMLFFLNLGMPYISQLLDKDVVYFFNGASLLIFSGWVGPIVGGALMQKVGFQSMTSVSVLN